MNKEKLTVDVVLTVATELIQQNGSTTTLDVKRTLRAGGKFEAFQGEISNYMRILFDAGKLSSTNDPSLPYQTYDLPTVPSAPAIVGSITTDLKEVAKDLISRATNPALLWIFQKFDYSFTRSQVVKEGGYSGSQVDSALQALLKKNIITRTGPGEYQMNSQVTTTATPAPVADPTSTDPLHTRIKSIIRGVLVFRLGLDVDDPALNDPNIKIVGDIGIMGNPNDPSLGATEPDLLEIINDLEDSFDINISTPYNTPRELQDFIYAFLIGSSLTASISLEADATREGIILRSTPKGSLKGLIEEAQAEYIAAHKMMEAAQSKLEQALTKFA